MSVTGPLDKTIVYYCPPHDLEACSCDSIAIQEAKYVIGSGPNTGLRTWEAALRLACYLESNPELIQGRKVLELGAGTGFLSLYCATYLQPSRVIVTDGHEQVLTSLKRNIEGNYHRFHPKGTPVHLEKLMWDEDTDLDHLQHTYSGNDESREEPVCDMVIGADITYHPDLCVSLARTLSKLAKTNPYVKIVISATERDPKTLNDFIQMCQSQQCGLRVEALQYNAPQPHDQKGLFHNVAMPINIYTMWYVPESIS